MVQIREALASETPEVLALNERAFGTGEGAVVAQLVSDLLADPSAAPVLSLVAVEDGAIVGHVLFSRARLAGAAGEISAAILAPLAVEPKSQGRGIGGALIDAGVRALSQAEIELIFLAGHPSYYPRHGFEPASKHGFEAPYPFEEKNADGWMVRRVAARKPWPAAGRVICAEALDREDLWRA